MRKFDLIVIGELNVDLIITGDDVVPEFGQREKLVDDVTLTLGSSSAIFACQSGKLGLKTAFLGKVGDDDFGKLMIRTLAAHGVDTTLIIEDERLKTGISVNLSRPKDRAILTYLGSIAALQVKEIDLSILQQARHLHVSSYFLQKGLRENLSSVFAAARRNGLTVSFDTGWDPDEEWNGALSKALAYVDVFLPNEEEALAVSGAQSLEAAMDLLSQRVGLLVVKRGARGALARRGEEVWEQPAFLVTTVDAIGAGDSFNAGFLYGYLKGLPPGESLRIGCACGALSTIKPGGTAGQPTLAELKNFLKAFRPPRFPKPRRSLR